MPTDRELLQRYARDASDDAFAELVRRHVALVYGSALRQLCGHPALAADVTQAVFTALAAQRAHAHRIKHLTGWLHGTTRHTVSHTVRAERRRQAREHQAHLMHALLHDSSPADSSTALPPELIDEVLAQLDAPDREAVLRRFFEGQSFAALGATLSLSEDAARMRVTRALEKLRALFARRGIHSTAAALGAALTGQTVAAPPHLTAGILASCAALAAASSSAPLATVTLMSTAKLALSLTGTAAAIALGVAGYQTHRTTTLAAELAQLHADQTRLTAALATSQQKAAALARRSADAETRAAELQGKLSAALATTAPRPLAPPASPEDEARRLNREKMARLKPLFAAGRPITGAVIVLVDGKPVSRPVEFVMDREVRIAEVDDGTYLITPTLNADGSVQYRMSVTRQDPATGTTRTISLPRVTQTPWDGFTLSTGGGRVFAFDPDKLDL